MNPLRTTARLLTGSTYAVLGADAVRAPGGRVGQAAPTLAALRKVVPMPADDEFVVRANAAVQAAAGALLAVEKAPRLSALALAASLVPTTAAGHAFWTIEDAGGRKLQRVQFHKNMAMIGGLLFAALDGQPRPADRRVDRRRPTDQTTARRIGRRRRYFSSALPTGTKRRAALPWR